MQLLTRGHERLPSFFFQTLLFCLVVTALPPQNPKKRKWSPEAASRLELQTALVGNELPNSPAGAPPVSPVDGGFPSSPIGSAAGDEVGPNGSQDVPITSAGYPPGPKQPQDSIPSDIPGSSNNLPEWWDPDLPQNQLPPVSYQNIASAGDQSAFEMPRNPQSQNPFSLTHINPLLVDKRFYPSPVLTGTIVHGASSIVPPYWDLTNGGDPEMHFVPEVITSPPTLVHPQAAYAGHSGDPSYPQGGSPNRLDDFTRPPDPPASNDDSYSHEADGNSAASTSVFQAPNWEATSVVSPGQPQSGPDNYFPLQERGNSNSRGLPGSEVDPSATSPRLDPTTEQSRFSRPIPGPLSSTPVVEATASEPTRNPGNIKRIRLTGLERSYPLKPLDLTQFPRFQDVVNHVAKLFNEPATTFENFVYRLYTISLPSLDDRRSRPEVVDIPDLMVINAALQANGGTHGSAPSELAEGSKGHDNTDDLLSQNQFVHFAVKYAEKLQNALTPSFTVHQIDLRTKDMHRDVMAIWIYIQYLVAQGINFRPSFDQEYIDESPEKKLAISKSEVDGSDDTEFKPSHKGRRRTRLPDKKGINQFQNLVSLELAYRTYLEDIVFPIQPSGPSDLVSRIRMYAQEDPDPKTIELFDVLNPDHGRPEFERKAVNAAITSVRRLRSQQGLTNNSGSSYLQYRGDYGHPTFAFSKMKTPKDMLRDLRENRAEYVNQFELHRRLFLELVSGVPYVGINLPVKGIPHLSDAFQSPVWYDLRQQFRNDARNTGQTKNMGSSKPKGVKSGPSSGPSSSFRGAEFATHVSL
ncbi:hypothetical protein CAUPRSCDRAFT_11203 [Caulochytrium protostelioides]|uniref:Uncharacterized protein n=1 Tax=Caulochytrium protostelioides TaxID=1555241 RepID=A0A4P9X0E1_9FUNG|nr:hypothetical protein CAUPRSCDRAFT_11203 [Caulochytrium protostelioides]